MSLNEETRRAGRREIRIPSTIRVHSSMEKDFILSQREINAYTTDLSRDGLGIISSIYIPEGVLVVVELDAKTICPQKKREKNKIELSGEIVSSCMAGGQYRLGVSIKEIKEEDKTAIADFIK